MPADRSPADRPSANANRDRLVAGLYAALHGIDASQLPIEGVHCNAHVGDVMAVLSVYPWDLSRPPMAPGEHPIRVVSAPVPRSPSVDAPSVPIATPGVPAPAPAPASASSAASNDATNLPSWLIDIERAVYEAATNTPQSVQRLATRAGYSVSRVREAVARLTGCEPPLLMRTRGGVKLAQRNPA